MQCTGYLIRSERVSIILLDTSAILPLSTFEHCHISFDLIKNSQHILYLNQGCM